MTDSLFHFADGRQVFIDLAAIVDSQPVAKLLGIVEHEIEDALAIDSLCAGRPARLWRAVGGKRRSKTSLGIDLLGHRHVGRTPGDVRGIRTAIAGIAVPRLRSPFDPQFERRQPGLFADLLGGHLVDRDPDADAGPVGLEGMNAGQKAGERAGVVAGAVAQGLRVMLGQPGQDEQTRRGRVRAAGVLPGA